MHEMPHMISTRAGVAPRPRTKAKSLGLGKDELMCAPVYSTHGTICAS